MTFVLIEEQVLLVDSDTQIEKAKTALREASLAEAKVWVGDPDEDDGAYLNGQVLFA